MTRHAMTATAVVLAGAFLPAGGAAAQQRLLIDEDFESGALPAGWTHFAGGPREGHDGSADCSTLYFEDVGLSGTSIIFASSDLGGTYPDGCYQATAENPSGCSHASFSNVGDPYPSPSWSMYQTARS